MSFTMTEEIKQKWDGVITAEGVEPIKDPSTRNGTIRLLENMDRDDSLKENTIGSAVTDSGDGTYAQNGVVNPILISLVRRAMPALIANDLIGVQPMSMSTGLVFAMRTYRGTDATGTETFVPNTLNPTLNTVTTAIGEKLGTDLDVFEGDTANAFDGDTGAGIDAQVRQSSPWQEVSFDIEKTSVEAKTRAMKASYTIELQQDLKAQHGIEAENELANLLTQELVTEMNREIVNLVKTNSTAETEVLAGSAIATAGEYDIDVADGRWAAEKYKMLSGYIMRQANKVAQTTGRGRANWVITSADVANALEVAGSLTTATTNVSFGNTSGVGVTLAGTMLNGMKVYIDQFQTNDMVYVGYKGASSYDAGLFYCPYIPFQMMRATGQDDFQPRMGFKTRYGLVANPYGAGRYYRSFEVKNLGLTF